MNAPFRPPHGEDCPICYPGPSVRQIVRLLLAVALLAVAVVVVGGWS